MAELETYANIWVTPDEDNSITSLQALDKMDALAAAYPEYMAQFRRKSLEKAAKLIAKGE